MTVPSLLAASTTRSPGLSPPVLGQGGTVVVDQAEVLETVDIVPGLPAGPPRRSGPTRAPPDDLEARLGSLGAVEPSRATMPRYDAPLPQADIPFVRRVRRALRRWRSLRSLYYWARSALTAPTDPMALRLV